MGVWGGVATGLLAEAGDKKGHWQGVLVLRGLQVWVMRHLGRSP